MPGTIIKDMMSAYKRIASNFPTNSEGLYVSHLDKVKFTTLMNNARGWLKDPDMIFKLFESNSVKTSVRDVLNNQWVSHHRLSLSSSSWMAPKSC